MYRPTGHPPPPPPAHHSMYGSGQYPWAGQPPPPYAPPPQNPSSSSYSPSGLGIKVVINPAYRISIPPELSPNVGDVPRCTFNFDFALERKVLAEAEKDHPKWNNVLENISSKTTKSTSSMGLFSDPAVEKYVSLGFTREAATLALKYYGDNPTKVDEFSKGYNTLSGEMGFPSTDVGDALLMHHNDTDKALSFLLSLPPPST